jgi:hypothetical protein
MMTTTNDFIILGPTMAPGNKVLEAIHALYYLPENFKLILTGSKNADRSFYKEALSLVERDELGSRVQFTDDSDSTDVVILPNSGMTRNRNSVAGDSPEALASAILDIARARG